LKNRGLEDVFAQSFATVNIKEWFKELPGRNATAAKIFIRGGHCY
jgi:hypothetical protein